MAKWKTVPLDREATLTHLNRLRAEHPAPCELMTTVTGKCTCGNLRALFGARALSREELLRRLPFPEEGTDG